MRRLPLILSLLAATIAVPARAATVTISVDDSAFSPPSKTVSMGTSLRWTNVGAAPHTATRTGIIPWDSRTIRAGASWCCKALSFAGGYPYRCTIHGFTGSVGVPDVISPLAGSTSTTFTITLGTVAPPSGHVFDLQKRRNSGSWAAFKTGLTGRRATFTAGSAGNATYSFRSRLRRQSDGARTNYSPPKSVVVGKAYVRVNQVGYVIGQPKRALLMSNGLESGATFRVIDTTGAIRLTAPIGAKLAAWSSAFPNVYALDFSSVDTPGTYSIVVTGPIPATSPAFAIGSGADLYTSLLPNARAFFTAQRDGSTVDSSVLNRQPSHLADASATVYAVPAFNSDGQLAGPLTRIGGPVDVSGGWADAGDYLKLVALTSYAEAVMLIGARDHGPLGAGGTSDVTQEARVGLDWLQKMWDDATSTLYFQVGLGDGNGTTIGGDHDYWRLPEADDARAASPGDYDYYVQYRPVFRAGPPGSSISPNLAGRLAADFGLCFQIYRTTAPAYANRCLVAGEHIYDLANTTAPGELRTAAPHDYYPEDEWLSDMELGATELYFATASGGLPPEAPHTDPSFYLQRAAQWADRYITAGAADTLNFYDVGALAHAELFRAITRAGDPGGLAVTKTQLADNVRAQLAGAAGQAAGDPFGLGVAYVDGGDVVPHALGLALTAKLYKDMVPGDTAYDTLARNQVNWILGENAWGASFVVGAGAFFPRCPHHQVANLAGSRDRTPPVLLGATVQGPHAANDFYGITLPAGARVCPPDGADRFLAFSGKGARYMEDVRAWPTAEPALDYTALTLLVFARQAA